MTSIEAYEHYLSLVNKNSTHANVKIPKGRFVILFNRESKRWLAEKLREDTPTDEKNALQNLLVIDNEVVKIRDGFRFSEFSVPNDLFKYESSFSLASREGYKTRTLHNWDFKTKNIEVLLQDENFKPSFDYEETLIQLANNKAIVYKTDFNLEKLYLTYYKNPSDIDIRGYIRLDGTDSQNISPELPDRLTDQILTRCAIETIRTYENPDGFQLASDRINKEK